MGSRWHRIFTELYRFAAVGGVATFVAFVIFNFLVHGFTTGHRAWLADQPILAFIAANTVGMLISYWLSRHWVFKHRPPQAADGGFTAYVVINVATMALPVACLWFSRHALGLDDPWSDNISANLIGLLLGQAARFYLYRTYVFQRPVHMAELRHPLQVIGEELDAAELFDLPAEPDGPVSEAPTDRSTTGRALPPGL